MKFYAVNSIFSIFLRGTAALISQISFSRDWKMHKLKNGFSFHFVFNYFLCELFVEQSYQNIEKSHFCLEDKALVILRWVLALNCPVAIRLWQSPHCGVYTNCVYTPLSILWYVYTCTVFSLWYITLWWKIILCYPLLYLFFGMSQKHAANRIMKQIVCAFLYHLNVIP